MASVKKSHFLFCINWKRSTTRPWGIAHFHIRTSTGEYSTRPLNCPCLHSLWKLITRTLLLWRLMYWLTAADTVYTNVNGEHSSEYIYSLFCHGKTFTVSVKCSCDDAGNNNNAHNTVTRLLIHDCTVDVFQNNKTASELEEGKSLSRCIIEHHKRKQFPQKAAQLPDKCLPFWRVREL